MYAVCKMTVNMESLGTVHVDFLLLFLVTALIIGFRSQTISKPIKTIAHISFPTAYPAQVPV